MIFDTHAHYDDKAFEEDRDSLLPSVFSNGVGFIIDPGCTVESSKKAMELSEKYDQMFFAAGIHPEELADFSPKDLDEIRALAAHPKCIAIGEIGLDYYWDKSTREKQIEVFKIQLQMAVQMGKPVIIHDREAHGDSMEIIREYPEAKGVFHCFSGSTEMAEELLKRGWYLGFDGPVTYKNARKSIEVLEITPLDRILIETDSPYMSPVPMRGKRNDSGNLKYVIEKIAGVKNMSPDEIEQITAENAKKLFHI